jgi:protein-disulfide isomerase
MIGKRSAISALSVVLIYVGMGSQSQIVSQRTGRNGVQNRNVNPDGIAAVINNTIVIRQEEVDEAAGVELYTLQQRVYDLRKRALDKLIAQIVLKEEAKRRGITIEELRKRLTPDSHDVRQSDIDRAYAENLSALGNMSEDEAKERIRLDIEAKYRAESHMAAVAELIRRSRIDSFLSVPTSPRFRINAEGPTQGPREAPVTIIEFSDFQCPYCKQAAGMLKSLLEGYGPEVRFVFKQLPLPIHPDAFRAAQASVCADRQGRFWEYHDILFGSNDISEPALKKYASDLGMKTDEFSDCMNSDASAAVVRRDMLEATRTDVQATPTFFINGRIVRGAKSPEDFKKEIDDALKQAQAAQKRGATR